MESTTFFARHNSGVIAGMWLCLYEEISCFALSSPDEETNNILVNISQSKAGA